MWLDPGDDGRIPNGWGSEYSVRHVAVEPRMVAATMVPISPSDFARCARVSITRATRACTFSSLLISRLTVPLGRPPLWQATTFQTTASRNAKAARNTLL